MFNLNELELLEAWHDNDYTKRWKACLPLMKEFPFWVGVEAKTLSVVYFEIEPGNALGEHTDSAEEIVLVLSGSAEAIICEEVTDLNEGKMVIIPEMASHSIKNTGNETVKCIGFYSKPVVTSTFKEVMQPLGVKSVGPQIKE
ncbi:cupin domain-containing protein [Virgibacillus byunsanensis]|uniref:Cupin domain-containing protein n=1 Tax=Virgibacillus byunsanensis TaxID=570945 RepID=A0ABW3LK46_9BACI